ncbi:MAG: tight adherence protein [Actinomycetota bacterium]|jgi:tight adherence protein C|nr:tight adherence protein [Actinomycetota bacterium]
MADIVLAVGLGGIFVAVVIILATIGVFTAEREQVGRSLAALNAIQSAPTSMRRELDRPFKERVIDPFFSGSTGLGRRLTPAGQIEKIRKRLDAAGSPPNWDVDRVLAFKVLGGLAGVVATILLSPILLGFGVFPLIIVGVVIIAAGFLGPDVVLSQKADARGTQMRKDLPDALDLLTISVEAGLAFDAALSQVARQTEGPLAEEFFRVLQEMQIGLGRTDAFKAMAERVDIDEVRSFVNALVQADAFGIPIAHVLRVQAKEMRTKRAQRAEEAAQKVPVKILFPLIFCIMPALFIVVIGPAALQISHALFHK